MDLPITGQVVDATPEKPYLCFRLDLEPTEIASLLLQADLLPLAEAGSTRGLFLSRTSPAIVDAVLRLLRLLATQEDIPALAPLAEREILYRLLKSAEGYRLRQVASVHGQTSQRNRRCRERGASSGI